METLVTLLTKQQQVLRLNDARFAKKLKISRPFWTAIKKGKRRIGVKFLKSVTFNFPNLDEAVLDYLKGK